jgi:hypothetical protein
MIPAFQNNIPSLILLTGLFLVTTVITILSMVKMGLQGLSNFSTLGLNNVGHIAMSSVLLICGLSIKLLGL